MPTDDERCEVAARLRGPFDVIGQGGYVSLNRTLFGMQLLANSENELRAGVRRLADLIEPSCDRDALLALADEMYGRLDEYDVGLHGGIYMANEMRRYARRIREALGVEK